MKKTKKLLLALLALLWTIWTYSFADTTWMTITLTPWWNVISTPALLSNVSFSNGWNGITFSKLESWQWVSVVPNTSELIPLEGFLVRNTNNSTVDMTLSFRDTTPSEDMLSKNITAWWNLLWITTLNDPFYSITPKLYLDFTSNFQVNLFNTININYVAWNGTVPTPEYWEAYWIFVSSNSLYGWSNNRNVYDWKISNKSDYEPIIKVTPWSYNIPLLKWTITVDKTVSLNNSWLYIEINWANPFEDIWWYEAGWIIYEILVKVDSCVWHLSYNRYDDFALDNWVTDESWYKKLPVYLDKCTKLSAWTHEISVLMWINREYYQNFKTWMTITMSPITVRSFNNSSIAWQILPSVVEVSHDNLPHLLMWLSNHYVDEVYIDSWVAVFPLWAWNLFIDDTGVVASILLSTSNITDNDVVSYNMYVDTYVNWELLDTQLYKQTSIKHEIPLEYNTNTLVEFRWRMISNITWAFIPTVTVNKIIKNNISYITHSCDYYAWWCTNFGMWNYIFDGKPSYVNWSVASWSISNDIDYTPLIKVTPGSYNIPLIKWRVYIDDEAYLNMDRFIVSIFGANPYEDVLWYEAGWIIYDMTVRVWDCVSSVSNDLYNIQTNADGFAQFSVPIPEECKTVPAWATKIEVWMWINKEYYRNFKTWMIITIDPSIVWTDFNSLHITWKIKSSAIHVSHNNLPRLTISNFTDPTNVFYINPWAYEFPLRSWDFYTDETWVVANVLLKKAESTWFDMYVSTYVNWELVDEQSFDGVFIKHEIPVKYNTPTTVEFKWRMVSNATWYMRPSVIVNRIIKNDINYITHNCDYYAWWCNEFGFWSYIFYWWALNIGASEFCTNWNGPTSHTSSEWSNEISLANISCVWDGSNVTLSWIPTNKIWDVYVNLYNESTNNFDRKGTVNTDCENGYSFTINQSTTPIVMIENSEWLWAYKSYTCHKISSINSFTESSIESVFDWSDALFGYDDNHKLSVNSIYANSIVFESPVLVDDLWTKINDYILLYGRHSFDELQSDHTLLSSFTEVPFSPQDSENTLYMILNSNLDVNSVYYVVAIPRDDWDIFWSASNQICFKLKDRTYWEWNECANMSSTTSTTHTSSSWASAIGLANVSCTWSGTKVAISWVPTNNIWNAKILLYNESTNNFDIKWTVNMDHETAFSFNINQSTAPIVRFADTEELSIYKTFTCHKLSTTTSSVTPTVTPVWCTAEELSACLTSPDYNACIANCQ